jgi:hypothetical protein
MRRITALVFAAVLTMAGMAAADDGGGGDGYSPLLTTPNTTEWSCRICGRTWTLERR